MLGATVVMSFSSCGGKRNHTGSQDRKYTVGISIAQETGSTLAMRRAIDTLAQAEDVSIIWVSAEQNEAAQEESIKKFLTEKVQGIIIDPVNPLTAGLLLDTAASHGIPIAVINALPESGEAAAFIIPDLKKAGENLVRSTIQYRRRPGKILILISELPDSSEMALVRSMLPLLQENSLEYRVYGLSTDSSTARRTMNSILFSPSPPSAVISTRVFHGLAAGDLFRLGLVLPRPVLAVYSDEQQAGNALQNGTIDILADPQPTVVGTTALSSIVRVIQKLPLETDARPIRRGKNLTPIVPTRVRFVVSPNISDQKK